MSGRRRVEAVVRIAAGGRAECAGLLDSTLRHRGRRLLVESPPPGLDAAARERLIAAAIDAARAAAPAPGWYTVALAAGGAPAVEGFTAGLPRGVAALEVALGVDLRGDADLAQLPSPRGHACHCTLAACDPERELAPAPGRVETLRLPAGPGVQVEPAVGEGDRMLARGEPALVALTAFGSGRERALDRLRSALARTYVTLVGGATDKAFLVALLEHPEVAAARADEIWLEGLLASGGLRSRRGAEAALLAAAVLSYETHVDQAKRRFLDLAQRGRPEASLGSEGSIGLDLGGHRYLCRVAKLAPRSYRVEVDGAALEIELEGGPAGRARLRAAGAEHEIFARLDGHDTTIEVDGVPHRLAGDPGMALRSPMPAIVSRLAVVAGQEVSAGAPLLVLEAMKMETTLTAERAGRIRRLLVSTNSQVAADQPLLVLDPAGRPEAGEPDPTRLTLAPLAAAAAAQARPRARRAALEHARRLFLGYDLDPDAVVEALEATATAASPGGEALEDAALGANLDVIALFRPRPAEDPDDELRRSVEEYLFTYLRDLDGHGTGLPPAFIAKLRRALAHYGVGELERTPELEEALFRLTLARQRQAALVAPALALLERRLDTDPALGVSESTRRLLDRLLAETRDREPALYDLAREVRYRRIVRPLLLDERRRALGLAERDFAVLAAAPDGPERAAAVRALVENPQRLHEWLSERFAAATPALRRALLEVMVRRYYRVRDLGEVRPGPDPAAALVVADYEQPAGAVRLIAAHAPDARLDAALAEMAAQARDPSGAGRELVLDLYLWAPEPVPEQPLVERLERALAAAALPASVRRVAFTLASRDEVRLFTFRRDPERGDALVEERLARGLHPLVARRLQLWRLSNFRLERLPAPESVHLFHGIAHENPRDERYFVLGEIRSVTRERDTEGKVTALPELERALLEAAAVLRRAQSRRPVGERPQWNRIVLAIWPALEMSRDELNAIALRLAPHTAGLGLQKVVIHGHLPGAEPGGHGDWVLEVANPGEGRPQLRLRRPSQTPLKPLREYAQKVVDLRRRGLVHPYEMVRRLAPPADVASDLPPGDFVEHDLDESGRLVPVDRPAGRNSANVVAGVVRNFTARHPEGMARVILLGDAARGMGALAEPECRRISAALDLAERMGVPLEWFALSAGARIAMDSGTENMDWIARVLRRLIEFTQRGGEVNIVVVGINVGAQPYWNAEATMLMHTRGILVMTPDAAMVLTGKRALDFSGGVSADDNLGIGGYQRIMGPNGQAQYLAADLADAGRILLAHYEHTYVAPGERFPRPAPTGDARDRDIRDFPHGGDFATVGEVFSDETNPGRKRPFEIRKVLAAVADQDHPTLERWPDMRDAEIAVVWDAHLGGHAVCLLGFESRPIRRLGWVPAYGPRQWTGGTLFPQSSRKIARAINSASGNRPLVVLANLSGFDGSPESMRRGQLEFGAEIGRAVVNFRGPIVFVVVSRYHGGAFVVFSGALHDNMQVAALEGTAASVIGGAPAAAVVFAREVEKRALKDPRLVEIERALADPRRADRAELQRRFDETLEALRSEKLGEVAVEYDRVHDVARALRVGSVQEILPAARLRPWLIEAVERGMRRELERGADAR